MFSLRSTTQRRRPASSFMLRTPASRLLLLLRPPPRARGLATPPSSGRPSEQQVKNLAQQAKMQQSMWNLFVPEQGIRFGDKCAHATPPARAQHAPTRLARTPQALLDAAGHRRRAAHGQRLQGCQQAEGARPSGWRGAPSSRRRRADGGRRDPARLGRPGVGQGAQATSGQGGWRERGSSRLTIGIPPPTSAR